MYCRHNFRYTQGHFYCTKCGKQSYRNYSRRNGHGKKIGFGIVIVFLIFFAGFLAYQNQDVVFQNLDQVSQTVEEQIQPTNTESYKVPIIPKRSDEVTSWGTVKKTTDETGNEIIVLESETRYGDNRLIIPELEHRIHDLINNERENRALKPLSFDNRLSSLAREHSEDMSARNFFDHDNPDGQDPTARGLEAGYSCHKELGGGYYSEGIAENIFQNNLYDSYTQSGTYISYNWLTPEEIAQSTVDGWMHSSGHKQNILTETYDKEGIGASVSSDHKVYITEDFC